MTFCCQEIASCGRKCPNYATFLPTRSCHEIVACGRFITQLCNRSDRRLRSLGLRCRTIMLRLDHRLRSRGSVGGEGHNCAVSEPQVTISWVEEGIIMLFWSHRLRSRGRYDLVGAILWARSRGRKAAPHARSRDREAASQATSSRALGKAKSPC